MQFSFKGTLLLSTTLAVLAAPAWAQQTPAPGNVESEPETTAAPITSIQTTDQNEVEEVYVTARRINERAQDIPVAVSALNAEQLERRSISGLEDIAGQTVGFSYENFTASLGAPVIRGQTQTRLTNPVQNVASFFNGVYLQRGYMIDASLLDVERVEVVKGPQSALYGRNAFSGVINYITRRPDDEFEARGSLTVGTDERLDYGASVSVPLIADRLGVLFSFAHSEFDGTWENNHPLADSGPGTEGNAGGWDNDSYLLVLSAKPTDRLEVDLTYSHTKLEVESQPSYTIATTGLASAFNALNCSPLPSLTGGPATIENRLYCGEIPAEVRLGPGEVRLPGLLIDPRTFGQRGQSEVLSLQSRYALTDDLSLSYLFGWTKTDVNVRGNPMRDPTRPALPFPPFNVTITDSQPNGGLETRQHEVRLEFNRGRLRSFIGAEYFESEDLEIARTEGGRPVSLDPIVVLATFGNRFREESSTSVFGFVEYAFTDQLQVSLEGRWTQDEQSLEDRLATPVNRNTPNGYLQSRTEEYFTPRVAIDYQVTPRNLLYASVGTGVKAGGINGGPFFLASQVPTLCPGVTLATATIANCAAAQNVEQQSYNREENITYEVGSKNDLFDRRLRLNLAAFYVDWTDLQITAARRDSGIPQGSSQPTIIGNVGGVEVKGFEVEGFYRATDALRLNYGFSYTDSQYTDDSISQRFRNSQNCDGTVCPLNTPSSGGNIGGNQLERTPKTEALFGAEYESTFGSGYEWFVRGDVSYQSKQFVDEYNLAWVPERTLVNARAGISKDFWNVQFWVRNLFDKEYVTTSLFLIGTAGARTASYVPLLGERRTMGITLKATY